MSPDLALACLFSSAPISACGQPAIEPVLASTWPLAAIFVGIALLAGLTFLRSIYRHRIDWSRDPAPEWDVGTDDLPTIEIRTRHAGE